MADDSNYVCKLDEASIKKGREELKEDPKERLGAVQALRDWLQREEKWIKSLTETEFLLAFLRCRKFSQLEARGLLERFWTVRTKYPEWYKSMDPVGEENLKMLRESCVYLPLPKRDKEGRFIMLGRLGRIRTDGYYDADAFLRAYYPMFDLMLFTNENLQVNGWVFVMDFTDVTLKLQTFFGFERMKRSTEVTQKALPARIKQLNYYNTGPVFEAIFTVFKQFLSQKFKDRIVIHGTKMTSVYKEIDPSLLPDEYLPDDYTGPSAGSCQEILENFIKTTLTKPDNVKFLRRLYGDMYGVDLKNRPADDEPQASFRKLNVE